MTFNRYKTRMSARHLVGNLLPNTILTYAREYRDKQKYLKRFHILIEKQLPEMPFMIQIETFNRCNGECAFCPVNKNVDSRKPAKMTESVFDKIISELGSVDFNGKIALFSNNEPLLDTRIYEFARIARERVPDAYIYIYIPMRESLMLINANYWQSIWMRYR